VLNHDHLIKDAVKQQFKPSARLRHDFVVNKSGLTALTWLERYSETEPYFFFKVASSRWSVAAKLAD